MTSLREKPAGLYLSKHGVLVEIHGICMHIIYIYIYMSIYLVGGFNLTPLKNDGVSSSVGMIFHSQYDGKVI